MSEFEWIDIMKTEQPPKEGEILAHADGESYIGQSKAGRIYDRDGQLNIEIPALHITHWAEIPLPPKLQEMSKFWKKGIPTDDKEILMFYKKSEDKNSKQYRYSFYIGYYGRNIKKFCNSKGDLMEKPTYWGEIPPPEIEKLR